jgi:hypothetical protein
MVALSNKAALEHIAVRERAQFAERLGFARSGRQF